MSVTALIAGGSLPASASRVSIAGTWRPGADGNPASYATAVTFEIGQLAPVAPVLLAAELAERLRAVPWIKAASPSGDGYLTVTVTPQAQAASAAWMVRAGLTCAGSAILDGATASVRPWPDLAAAASWQQAWQEQADAPPVLAAVQYFGPDSVRYRLARMMPGDAARLSRIAHPGVRTADPLYPVQQAHAAAASTLRWAAELHLDTADPVDGAGDPGERAGALLSSPAERVMLGLLSFLPIRVAAAARRARPDELPRYLEQVSAAWLACQQAAPALPFGGRAAATDAHVVSARLLLAGAVAAALAAGLALTGISAQVRV